MNQLGAYRGAIDGGLDRHHLAGRDVVDRTDDLQLSAGDEIGKDRLRVQERLDVEPYVLRGRLGEEIGGIFCLRRNDSGPDRIDQARQVTGKSRSILHHLDGRVDGAAAAVAQHHDQRNAEHHRAVFETGEAILIDEVARDAHHEQLARALIEGKLGRKAGIRAAHDAGERILRLRAGDASDRVVPAGRRIAGVAGVALLQVRERLIGADGVGRRRGRLRPGRQRRKRRSGGGDQSRRQEATPRKACEIALRAHECIVSLLQRTPRRPRAVPGRNSQSESPVSIRRTGVRDTQIEGAAQDDPDRLYPFS